MSREHFFKLKKKPAKYISNPTKFPFHFTCQQKNTTIFYFLFFYSIINPNSSFYGTVYPFHGQNLKLIHLTIYIISHLKIRSRTSMTAFTQVISSDIQTRDLVIFVKNVTIFFQGLFHTRLTQSANHVHLQSCSHKSFHLTFKHIIQCLF